MARRTGRQSNEQLFCWEQIEKTNRLFRVSFAFAPTDIAGGLLPLYALFSVVEEACSGFSDEQIARGKLAWWRQECLGRDPGPGSHPIIKELTRHARLGSQQTASVAQLLDDAESRLDEAAPSSLEELRRRCAKVSEPQLQLEMSISGFEGPDFVPRAEGLGAATGLVQLLRESLRRSEAGAFWWLPLDLLARHGVSRSEVLHAQSAESVRDLFSDILGQSRDWSGWLFRPHGPITAGSRGPTHLVVHAALQARLAARLQRCDPERFRIEMSRTRPFDVYHAWKMARRVNRP